VSVVLCELPVQSSSTSSRLLRTLSPLSLEPIFSDVLSNLFGSLRLRRECVPDLLRRMGYPSSVDDSALFHLDFMNVPNSVTVLVEAVAVGKMIFVHERRTGEFGGPTLATTSDGLGKLLGAIKVIKSEEGRGAIGTPQRLVSKLRPP